MLRDFNAAYVGSGSIALLSAGAAPGVHFRSSPKADLDSPTRDAAATTGLNWRRPWRRAESTRPGLSLPNWTGSRATWRLSPP